MGTRQPAIARIESGQANVRLSTLVDLAEALNTTIRVELEPAEMLFDKPPHWWERDPGMVSPSAASFQFMIENIPGVELERIVEGLPFSYHIGKMEIKAIHVGSETANNNLALSA